MPPTPLPKASSPEVKDTFEGHPNHLSAYNMCLNNESEHANANSENKLRHVRILGFLLLHAPNVHIRAAVCKCILDSSDLSDVGEFFERNIISIFKRVRGRPPTPSEHSSRSSFDSTKEQVKVDITQAPRDHKAAKALALRRDNWKCVVTGFVDFGAPENSGQGGVYTIYTHCAHILPESTLFGVGPKSEDMRKREYSASILAVLKRFGYDIEKFNGEKIHSLINVMSLEANVHELFDRLQLYFQSTSMENTYEIKWFFGNPPNLPKSVTFTTSDPVNLPVPSRQLLDLHATCCKVAHLSGAAEYIDTIYRDADEMDVLSADGASGDMFSYLLSSASKSIVNVQG